MITALSPTMTVHEFENGYWYREQLKDFAERIGIARSPEDSRKTLMAFSSSSFRSFVAAAGIA